MSETSATIAQWSNDTFGPVDVLDVVKRAAEEFAELRAAVAMEDGAEKIAEEIADVVIVLCRLAREYDTDPLLA